MGYVRKPKTYRLVFTDEDMAGLEVVAKSASLADYRRIAELATREFSSPPVPDDLVEIDNLFDRFAEVLVSWNLEEETDDGLIPVPATLLGLQSQELPFVIEIIEAWMEAVAGVSAPLGQPSPDGGPSVEESIPMEVLSPSL